jgi:Cu(I)/Ag(I) efflux system membrane fusion protein
MAFDGRGAKWLQDDGPVANPYFGNAMLRCGEDFDLQAKAR